jgi:hypothetical protein
MNFSPQLEERFAKMLTRYPEGRTRSAVIPMLMYAQDEVGAVTKELIEEVARRCKVMPLQVDEVVGYYSMLHRKPMGKFHVQVCTNISCLLVGGEELRTHRRSWASDTSKRPRTASSRWKKSSAWVPAPGRRRSRSTTTSPFRDPRKTGSIDRRSEEGAVMAKQLYNQPSRSRPASSARTLRSKVPRRSTSISRTTVRAFRKAKDHARGHHRAGPQDCAAAATLASRRGSNGACSAHFQAARRCVNAMRANPAYKDRLLMEYDPHQMIEGILIAGLAVDAHKGYIYTRWYRYLIDAMDRAIDEAYAKGYLATMSQAPPVRSLHSQRCRRI